MTSRPSLDPDDLSFSVLPPNDLLSEWEDDIIYVRENIDITLLKAYQAGADAELEACCEWLAFETPEPYINALRTARRPKPPSLKEQAQAELKRLIALIPTEGAIAMAEPIRRALEALPDD
jgi:hypothetical protein